MREDFFYDQKDLHLHVDRDVYLKLRSIAYVYGTSINELVKEFCMQLVNDKPNAARILEDLATKKAEQQLGRKPLTSQKGLHKKQSALNKEPLTHIETNILYNLIDKKGKKDDSEDEDEF